MSKNYDIIIKQEDTGNSFLSEAGTERNSEDGIIANPKTPQEACKNIDILEGNSPGSRYVFRGKTCTANEVKKEIMNTWKK